MAAALEETTVSYEDLAAIEREFDDVETEISTLRPLPSIQRRSNTEDWERKKEEN